MSDIPSKKEIVGLVEAQAASVDDISKRLAKMELSVEKQDSRNKNIIIAVLVAFIFIIGTVAIEVIISNRDNGEFSYKLNSDLRNQDSKIGDLINKVDNLKVRNPYLK